MNKIGAEIYFDDSNHWVGISGAAPNEKLEVNGTAKTKAFIGDGYGLTGFSVGGTVVSFNSSELSNRLYYTGDMYTGNTGADFDGYTGSQDDRLQ